MPNTCFKVQELLFDAGGKSEVHQLSVDPRAIIDGCLQKHSLKAHVKISIWGHVFQGSNYTLTLGAVTLRITLQLTVCGGGSWKATT